MDTETFSTLVFWTASILFAINSFGLDQFVLKNSPFAGLKRFISNVKTVIHDFRSAKFYKPWSTAEPIIITDKKQILELSEASTVLSQRAVYADMFGFKHTLNNFDHNEVNSQKSRLFGRLIQVNGVHNLPQLFPRVEKRINESLTEMLPRGKPTSRGISLPIAETVRTMASRAMCVIFFGENLSRDPIFANAILEHPKEMVSCMTAFQITPSFLSTYVHKYLTKGGKSQSLILEKLAEIMGSGRDAWAEAEEMNKLTLAWNMADLTEGSKYWQGPEHLAQSMLGIWFAAAHQPWMFLDFIMLTLAVRPDLQEALRQEIGDFESLDYNRLQNLPFLDSFIKETVRLHPLDTMAVRRKAMKDYTFASGAPFCPSGATVCVSSYDQMHDTKFYPNPNDFQPRRFVDVDSPIRGAKFVEVSEKYPIWGFGSLACPGRVHASIVIKMVIAQLLHRFEISLENEKERRMWSWETFRMPYESTRFILKERSW